MKGPFAKYIAPDELLMELSGKNHDLHTLQNCSNN